MKTKKIGLIAVILAICLASAAFTIAFISRQIKADNIITFGSVDLVLHENYINTQGKEVAFDTSKTTDVTYDSIQNRIFRVENTGKHPLYVRVSFELSGQDKDGKSFETKDFINLKAKQSDWTYKDGWYYYRNVLDSDKTTEKLITDVIFDIDKITTNYPGSKFKLDVIAQGVQSENNSANVLQATGWPAN